MVEQQPNFLSEKNSVVIEGRIITDVEIREAKTGGKMVRFSIVNNFVEVDEVSGEARTDTSFVSIIAWGEGAKLLYAGRPQLRKGDYVEIAGRLSIKTAEDKAGNKRVYTQVVLSQVTKRDRSSDKRQSGAGTAGGSKFKHSSQTTIADRYSAEGLNNNEQPLYEADVEGYSEPSLGDVARRVRYEGSNLAVEVREAQERRKRAEGGQKTSVVNKRQSEYDIYIGRPSKWGNPFVIDRDGSREEVIAKYREWILKQPELLAALGELKGKRLGCFCKPEACHGDVLVELIEKRTRAGGGTASASRR